MGNVKRDIVPKVINQMVIQYLRVPYTKSEKFQLFIKMPTGKYLILTGSDISLNDTIQNLKAVIQNKEGDPPEKQVIHTLGGKTLEDWRTLNDYGIHNEMTLIMSIT